MIDRRRSLLSLLFGMMLLAPAPCRGQVTIFFDGNGAENGVTEPGTTSFSFMGANWSGGVVRTERIPPLYASGSFSYEVPSGPAHVSFDDPVDSVRFFYVHGFGFSAGTATAFDAANNSIAMASSRQATSFADPSNFVALDPEAPIARIEFSAGVIDDFSFRAAAPTTPTPTHTGAPTGTSAPVPTVTDTPSVTASPTATHTLGPVACVGDCSDDKKVTVDELVRGVNIALGHALVADCSAFDTNADRRATVNELVAAVAAALAGCR